MFGAFVTVIFSAFLQIIVSHIQPLSAMTSYPTDITVTVKTRLRRASTQR